VGVIARSWALKRAGAESDFGSLMLSYKSGNGTNTLLLSDSLVVCDLADLSMSGRTAKVSGRTAISIAMAQSSLAGKPALTLAEPVAGL